MGTTQLQDFRLYTIGWVAALSKELTAAKAMLDENHDQPANFRQTLSDTNNYTWGRIGKHNIVIASLPEGKYGLVSAAVTASFMISSLPHLRFGLMVGIGAGIPRPGKDIRLGDVVVSTPAGEHPGVVQYDLGKLESDGRFKRVGSLAPPPRILLTALTNLKATQPLEGSQVPSILDAMLERYPLLRSQQHGYFHQGPQNDRLFIASSVHVEDNDAIQRTLAQNTQFYMRLQLMLSWLWSLLLFLCTARWKPTRSPLGTGPALSDQTKAAPPQATATETCTHCDPTKEIQRSARLNSHPVVHYGVIASGNIVVKDSLSRDAILDRLGPECICFEMEAAGLMDNFPCLVVRGICDYANNHKSDQWQNYAAATAAAYAKELLVGYIRAEDVQNADGIEELMGRGQ
ncbi:nacht and ankyrin domain protein [Colletotrichum karsti]|uniref:Nacht and ankyrin domain protein n=1 Tax=Colletotrichum karsti TaxID=1095194 RepID=A0A9P6IIS0_9PEZI|nr:nacht and ankyrin domain protein [Colletotrichum karsti]KAF9880360.1 nacht and ankyrin domain protein [Colletotrichum karsti]